MAAPRVLVTGASGYLGGQLVAALAAGTRRPAHLAALDVREVPRERRLAGVAYETADIREPGLAALLERHAIDTVVHLASIVTPGRDSTREFEYSVDVLGTENVLKACVAGGVEKIIVSSSGAAYGYHADNPAWIDEDTPLRGNPEFAYSWHKRLVEEMLAEYRARAPQLAQVVFRIGTILGESVRNQITDLFEKPRLIAIQGSDSPFVFIWDQDVVGCMVEAVYSDKTGVYNVAGDGALGIREIAARLGKRCAVLPAWLLRSALALLKPLGLTQYGPEQVNFLRYRPVLDNRRLKEVFGYVPKKTSAEVFEFYRTARTPGRAVTQRDFSGKVVVITGAAGGLGRALARAFASAGARIAALDRDAAGVEALAAELRSEGRQAFGLECDVTDAAACERAMAAAIATWGRIDVLVNNAGITHRSAWRRTDPAVTRRVMEVNFFGSVQCTRAALDALIASRGLIIVISSVAGFAPLIARTGYAAAKHALHGFFDSLRTELAGAGVGVLLVCPSFIDTGIDKNALGGDGRPARHAQQIVGERARAQDVAADILRAARSGKHLLLPGRMAKLSWWVSRLAPRYYARVMARRLRGEMDGG